MAKTFVPALMRVVRYTEQYKVLRDYTTYALTVPAVRPKQYKKGSGIRLRCDGMAIGEQLIYEQYVDEDIVSRGTCYMFRSPIKGGCLLIVPAHMYHAHDIDTLMNKERSWHNEYGWIGVDS